MRSIMIELLEDYRRDCHKLDGRIVPYIYTISLSKQLLSKLSKLVNILMRRS
jgi:hypothetical protein